jgi:hypothetical protein
LTEEVRLYNVKHLRFIEVSGRSKGKGRQKQATLGRKQKSNLSPEWHFFTLYFPCTVPYLCSQSSSVEEAHVRLKAMTKKRIKAVSEGPQVSLFATFNIESTCSFKNNYDMYDGFAYPL